MALKKYITHISCILILNSCITKENHYRIVAVPNKIERTSTIFLLKNDIKIDSVYNIGSYYANDSIIDLKNNQWDYYYHGRCGTGCSIIYYMRIMEKNERIRIALNILSEYKENDFITRNSLQKKYLINDNKIQKTVKINGNLKEKYEEKISLDNTNNIYYNTFFYKNGIKYYGIKTDSLNYLYLDRNNWKIYVPTTQSIEDLR